VKKEDGETRKYLLKTISILQQHLKFSKIDKKSNNTHLSAQVYDIVKTNLNHFPKNTSKIQLEEYTSQSIINKENHQNDVNKSTASLLNMSSINIKRRSNSTLDEYFKEKFGSPAKDVLALLFRKRQLKRNSESSKHSRSHKKSSPREIITRL
jgi:hypothetical protein